MAATKEPGNTDLIFDEGSEWKVVEEISEESPHIGVPVLPQTFIVEAIYLRDLPRFVIATENGDTVPVAELQRDQKGDGFDGVVSSIDVVSHEQVVCVG